MTHMEEAFETGKLWGLKFYSTLYGVEGKHRTKISCWAHSIVSTTMLKILDECSEREFLSLRIVFWDTLINFSVIFWHLSWFAFELCFCNTLDQCLLNLIALILKNYQRMNCHLITIFVNLLWFSCEFCDQF